MKFLSVCSGIEAASAAWSPPGWKAVAFSEIEPFPCAVLAHHYPDTPNWGDMTKYKEWPDVAIDLLCGGTPCQSFSVAGLRKGLDDPRGNLMLTFGAIAAKYRPRWLVWENVPGVLSSNGGRDFGSLLGLLGQLGYGFAYRVLDAQYFGVPQRRRRVFVVGCLGDWRSAAAVLFERHSLSGHPAPRREAGQVVTPTIRAGAANGGAGHGARSGDSKDELIVPVAQTLRAQAQASHRADTETYIPVAHSLRGEGFDASEDGTGRGTPLVPVAYRAVGADTYNGALTGEVAATFGTQSGDGVSSGPSVIVPAIAFSAKDHGGDATEELSPTLRAGAHANSHANSGVMPAIAFNWQGGGTQTTLGYDPSAGVTGSLSVGQTPAIAFNMHKSGNEASSLGISTDRTDCLRAFEKSPFAVQPAANMQVRRLTPEECEALQGFTRGYTAVPHRGKPAADGPRYKALGNSWAVPVAAWVGKRISEVEAIRIPQKEAAAA